MCNYSMVYTRDIRQTCDVSSSRDVTAAAITVATENVNKMFTSALFEFTALDDQLFWY